MLVPGARVRLLGLRTKPELNLKKGVCKVFNPENSRWTVTIDGGFGEVALKAVNLELVCVPQQGGQERAVGGVGGPPPKIAKVSAAAAGVDAASVAAAAEAATDQTGIIDGLEKLLAQLNSTRGSVEDVMVYCLDNAPLHGAMIAKRLAGSLGKVGLAVDVSLARLFVISDVLHNSGCKQFGGTHFRKSLQEHLPDAMERFGRLWLRRLEQQDEREHGEAVVRQVLQIWDGWRIFPPLYTKGLESLIFMQISDTSAKEAGMERDDRLRQKVTKWFSGMTQSELPWACCQRGLAGKALPTTYARSRLCHYEKYWHLKVGARVRLHSLQAAPHLNDLVATCEQWDFVAGRWKVRLDSGEVKAVRRDNLLLEDAVVESHGTPAEGKPCSNTSAATRPTEGSANEEYDSIDGEPLSGEELQEVILLEAAQAAEDARAAQRSAASYISIGKALKAANAPEPGRKAPSRWTEVSDPVNKYIVTPMA